MAPPKQYLFVRETCGPRHVLSPRSVNKQSRFLRATFPRHSLLNSWPVAGASNSPVVFIGPALFLSSEPRVPLFYTFPSTPSCTAISIFPFPLLSHSP